jgi:hypothetical protein
MTLGYSMHERHGHVVAIACLILFLLFRVWFLMVGALKTELLHQYPHLLRLGRTM